MRKEIRASTITELRRQFASINFPEYQREPNIWSLDAKQRLLDSIVRGFDIAPLYFYVNEDGSVDCIDGRQRINAIISFFGENAADTDNNGFAFYVKNELYDDPAHPFRALEGLRYRELLQRQSSGDALADQLIDAVELYKLLIVYLSGSERPEEFNLQFARLNLGMIINAGEKLHAMVGRMRDICFDDVRIGKHRFLEMLSIPPRRFAREQVAAQILAQVFSLSETGDYTKARHYDLQRFFKSNFDVSPQDERILEVHRVFEVLARLVPGKVELRNRAIAVTAVLIAWKREFWDNEAEALEFIDFLEHFLCRLAWQVGKGLDVDQEYRYLLTDFQRHVTQASVERYAVEARTRELERAFQQWQEHHDIRGDREYQVRTGRDPIDECRRFRNNR